MTKYIIFFKYIMKTIFKNTNFCFKNQSKLNISMIEKTTSPNVIFLVILLQNYVIFGD